MRRSTARLFVALTATAALVSLLSPAHAQADPGLSVTREGEAEDCPAEAELRRLAVQARASTASPPAHSYRVSFERTGPSYRAEIVDESTQRTRRLEDVQTECAPLGRAVAVALAMMWGTEQEDVPGATAVPEAATPPPASAVIARTPTPAPVPTSRWVLGAGAAAAFAVDRAAAPALLADGAFETARFSGALGVLWVPSQGLDVAPGAVDVRLFSGTARGCAFWLHGTRVGVCARLLAGALQAKSRGFDANGQATRPWFAAGVEAFVDGPLFAPWVSYRVAAGAIMPLHNETFSVDNAGSAYNTPPLGALASIAIQFATRGPIHESHP